MSKLNLSERISNWYKKKNNVQVYILALIASICFVIYLEIIEAELSSLIKGYVVMIFFTILLCTVIILIKIEQIKKDIDLLAGDRNFQNKFLSMIFDNTKPKEKNAN